MGMEWNQNWNGPSAVFKQVQVGEVSWPLVQQSMAIVLGKGNCLCGNLRTGHFRHFFIFFFSLSLSIELTPLSRHSGDRGREEMENTSPRFD